MRRRRLGVIGWFPAVVLVLVYAADALGGGAPRKLDLIFTDHMVVQRDAPIGVWGSAPPDSKITVTLAGQTGSGDSGASARWRVEIPPVKAGGPYRMVALIGGDRIVVEDVYVGDVWFACGQTNMAELVKGTGISVRGDKFPAIRARRFDPRIPRLLWHVADTADEIAEHFCAVPYFFARKVHQETKVPIGLIQCPWPGTRIETWISPEGFALQPVLEHMAPAPTTIPTTAPGGTAARPAGNLARTPSAF
jgi:sialate O-acetylesterase